MPEAILSVENVTLSFGGLAALDNLSLTLSMGGLTGVIGPNGAGKTSLFNVLTGVYAPDRGEVHALDRSLRGLKPFEIAGLGLVRTFQNIRLFKEMTVLDNVRLALHARHAPSLVATLAARPSAASAEGAMRSQAFRLLERLDLAPRALERAGGLPYGEQKRLEIARALAAEPKVLLLDEPAAGMNPSESAWLKNAIRALQAEFHLSILLIEHDMSVVMDLCERLIVLDHGQKIAEGPPETVRRDSRVLEAYLGTKRAAGGASS